MILLITNKEDITVDFIVQELKKRNCCYYRLNTEDIPEFIDVDFCIERNHFHLIDKKKGISINLLDVSSVYFRRPKISTLQYIPNLSNQEKIYLRSELSFCLEAIYKILKNAFSGSLSEESISFLSVLCENGDSALLGKCAGEFGGLYSKSLNISRAVVTSAVELSAEQKNALNERLQKKLKKKTETEYILDPSLIGGLKVEIDGVVFDGSLKKRLQSLKEVMEE